MHRAVLFAQTQRYLGADSFVHSLLMRGLPDLGFDVHVAAEPGSDPFDHMSRIPGVHMVPAVLGRSMSFVTPRERLRGALALPGAGKELLSLARYARRNNIKVVHATEKPRDVLLATALQSLSPARSLVHLHVKCHERLNALSVLGMKRAESIVGVSEFVRDSTIERGFKPSKVHAIPNAIDVDAWTTCPGDRSAVLHEFGLPSDALVILIAARIFSWKGHALLIDALAQVAARHPEVRLLIAGADDPRGDAGGGPLTVRLREQIDRLGLQQHVIFAGQRADMRRLYGACDIYAMPSFEEPFGLVYAEAMAMQKPVVALSNGGAKEVVVHGETGLLSQPGDVAGLAANICCLAENPHMRELLGRAGRKRVEREFSPERLCRDFAALYDAMIAR